MLAARDTHGDEVWGGRRARLQHGQGRWERRAPGGTARAPDQCTGPASADGAGAPSPAHKDGTSSAAHGAQTLPNNQLVPRALKVADGRTVEDGSPRGGRVPPARLPAAMARPVPGRERERRGSEDCTRQQGAGSTPGRENKDTAVTRSVPPACAQARLNCVVPPQGTAPPSYFFPGRIPQASPKRSCYK